MGCFGSKKSTPKGGGNGGNAVRRPMEGALSFTILLIGDHGVGKTLLVSKYVQKNAAKTVQQEQKIITLPDDRKAKLIIWDPMVSENNSGDSAYWRVTDRVAQSAILIVFSVNDLETFNNLDSYLSSVFKHAKEGSNIYIVANKCDLERKVGAEKMNQYVTEKKVRLLETTATNEANVQAKFDEVIAHLATLNPVQGA